MRVLRVLYELRPSGVEATLRATAPLWRERGAEIDILAIGPRLGPYAVALSEAGYNLYHIPLEPPRRFVPAYVRFLLTQDYDVVHVHPERANAYVAGLSRLVGTSAVVRSVHNVFPFSGALGIQRRLQRSVLRRLGVVHVSIGESVEATEWRHFRNKTVRIYNSYDDARFFPGTAEGRTDARARYGADVDDFVIVTVGNCSDVKNHHAVLHAVAALDGRVPVRYLHVGLERNGEPERRLAATLGIDDRASFLGHVDDVASVLRAADCFVMPSRFEGLGNAALEALGCGVPCVLADVPGLRDLRPFFSSVRWTAPEAAAIADALVDVAALPAATRESMGADLADAARRHFSSARSVERYADLYEHLLDRRPGEPAARAILRRLPPSVLRSEKPATTGRPEGGFR